MESAPIDLNRIEKALIRANDLKLDEIDAMNYTLGIYIRSAICSSLSDKAKYPEEPFRMLGNEDYEEYKKQKAIDEWVAEMENMQRNWEKAHNKNEVENNGSID